MPELAMGEGESRAARLVSAAVKPTANRLDLAGVFGLVAPLAATMALFKATGSIGRIQRDEPYWLLVAIALVLLAGTTLAVATFLSGEGESSKGKWWEKRLFLLAAACTALGFGIALWLVFDNADQEPRPMIAAVLSDDHSKLTAHVTASNLRTDDRLALKVDLATVRSGMTVDSVHPFEKYGTLPLQRTYVGPDSDGKIDQRVTMSIPTGGQYTNLVIKAYTSPTNQSCRELAGGADRGTACTILYLDPGRGRQPGRPQGG
ncbi:MAG TPA: hypothetical protein VF255_04800 [Solirubrobacterales bacterium]